MKSGLKNNSLASGLLGFIVGAGGVLGVQTLTKDSAPPPTTTTGVAVEHLSVFERVSEDACGPYVVTKYGLKFHDPGCSHLSASPASNIKHVNEDDAKAAGYTPCSACLKN